MLENSLFDKKSLTTITQAKPDWKDIARDAVCFANAAGGKIIFGIEDKKSEPPLNQKVPAELPSILVKKIHNLTVNVKVDANIQSHENGAEFIQLNVFNSNSIASTTNGKYYIRVQDSCKPLLPDDLPRLMTDKTAFSWELQTNLKVPKLKVDEVKVTQLIENLKKSERVSTFVKQKSIEELLEYYHLIEGEWLTNLGILWLGTSYCRAGLNNSPRVQFIKYDEMGKKINKLVWNDHSLSPLEMIEAVWNGIPDFKEGIEITDGLFRRNVPNYDEVVIRELLVNAIIHRPYNIMGDIFINLHPNYLEIHNPGLLPTGVTPENILHKSVQRNPHFSRLASDLKMMEQEGSGYDMIFQTLLSSGKKIPITNEGDDRVTVTVNRTLIKQDVILFMEKVVANFSLTQKEAISLALIAQYQALSALEFSEMLGLTEHNAIRTWLGSLAEKGLVKSTGNTKAKKYFVEPRLLKEMEFKGLTSLKNIAPHRLDELIRQDLLIYGASNISDIHKRTTPELLKSTLSRHIKEMVKKGTIVKVGERKWTKYLIK
jgi:ATP-dependent DNA helicase RecG